MRGSTLMQKIVLRVASLASNSKARLTQCGYNYRINLGINLVCNQCRLTPARFFVQQK